MLILPVFSRFELEKTASRAGLAAMLLALGLYYAAWARYFTRRDPLLLYEPLCGVPLPLAVSPVICLLAASIPLRSAPLAVAAVVFGVAHIAISWAEYGRLIQQETNQ